MEKTKKREKPQPVRKTTAIVIEIPMRWISEQD
jgi:hypothetical protein